MPSDAEEDYGFEYTDDDEPQAMETEVCLASLYSNSKSLSDPEQALTGYAEVVRMESPKGEWAVKALKQTVKLYYSLGRYREMMDHYNEMLTYSKSAVTKEFKHKCLKNIMKSVAASPSQNFNVLLEFYGSIIEEATDESLRFMANLNLCETWFHMGEYGQMCKILKELHKSCEIAEDTLGEGSTYWCVKVCAIEIQMYAAMKNNNKLEELEEELHALELVVHHEAGTEGVIKELHGKMHMAKYEWAEAAGYFFEVLQHGRDPKQTCTRWIKHLILADMASGAELDRFKECCSPADYESDPDILAMSKMAAAYRQNDVAEFQRTLEGNRNAITSDPFIRNCIEELSEALRAGELLKLIKRHNRISIARISKELLIPEKDVEQLLVSLILNNEIDGAVDHANRVFELVDRSEMTKLISTVKEWDKQLKCLSEKIREI